MSFKALLNEMRAGSPGPAGMIVAAASFSMLIGWGMGGEVVENQALTIYSPAPPTIMLHEHNIELGEALSSCAIENSVVPVALPKSINDIEDMAAGEKPFHLPIVTTIDFLPAIHKTGPEWHAYSEANDDLKFVSSLYDVAFGVLVFDSTISSPAHLKGKKIGAPPRPSAVRLYTEALLRDGWGIIDDVEIVDILPPDLVTAIEDGRIDAVTWNLMSETSKGFRPMVPRLLQLEGAHWIKVDPFVVDAINAANDFVITATEVSADDGMMSLLSFKQALAAWDATPDELVTSILTCIEQAGPQSEALPATVSAMADWPALSEEVVHDAAVEFYRSRDLLLQ